MSKQQESKIVEAILKRLRAWKYKVWRNDTGCYSGPNGQMISYGLCRGSSDIIGIAPNGRFVAIECKTEKGRLTDHQRNFLSKIEENDGIAIVARSLKDIDCLMPPTMV